MSPARAGVAANLGVFSNDVFRGRSVSAGHAVARLALSLDHPTGFYGGVSATGLLGGSEAPELLTVQEYGGYARRLRRDLTLDLGIVRTDYSEYWSGGAGTGYTEVYAGLIGRRAGARISLSPDYLGGGRRTAYGEGQGVLIARDTWRVVLHGGVLAWLSGDRPRGARRASVDGRLGVARTLGRFQLEASYAVSGPGGNGYRYTRRRWDGTPAVGVSAAF